MSINLAETKEDLLFKKDQNGSAVDLKTPLVNMPNSTEWHQNDGVCRYTEGNVPQKTDLSPKSEGW